MSLGCLSPLVIETDPLFQLSLNPLVFNSTCLIFLTTNSCQENFKIIDGKNLSNISLNEGLNSGTEFQHA